MELSHIIAASMVLSLIHASIPNHWLPVVAIGKTEKWSKKETIAVAAISGFSHTLSTILIGVVVGIVGFKLSESYEVITQLVGPMILIIFGAIYITLDFTSKNSHKHFDVDIKQAKKRSKRAIIISLCIAMFFSPCLEIEAYYFSASSGGWTSILLISVIYLFVTVAGMVLLVDVARRGIEKVRWHFLEHHEKLLSGIVLVLLGVISFFAGY